MLFSDIQICSLSFGMLRFLAIVRAIPPNRQQPTMQRDTALIDKALAWIGLLLSLAVVAAAAFG